MANSDSIKLNIIGLPVIQTVDDFSRLIHISRYTIYQLSFHSDKYYKTYNLPKKSGGNRKIYQPSKKLKGLQSWILVNILNKLQVSPSCKGFIKGMSTYDNALPHKGTNTLVTIDLQDFFPSISPNKVYNIFYSIGYNKFISCILTNICTYKNSLPQGSPCSPMLANLITWKLDIRIQGYVGRLGINYTRYADDLSFSGYNPLKVVKIIPMIKKILTDEGFKINDSKTRIAGSARAKIVTGLIVNNDIGIGKIKYKELRAKIHHLTFPSEQNNKDLLTHVQGWLSYINSVDKQRFAKAKEYINKLSDSYPNTLITKLIKH